LKREKVNINNFSKHIFDANISLLEMARDHSWNNISENCLFILSKFEYLGNAFESRIKRKKINEQKVPREFDEIIKELIFIYSDLYEVDLYVYKSKKEVTIIEIQYLLKSEHEKEDFALVKKDPPMIHCKVSIPSYVGFDNKTKFDINWELGGWRYKWNMFWWRLKIKKEIKNAKRNRKKIPSQKR